MGKHSERQVKGRDETETKMDKQDKAKQKDKGLRQTVMEMMRTKEKVRIDIFYYTYKCRWQLGENMPKIVNLPISRHNIRLVWVIHKSN